MHLFAKISPAMPRSAFSAPRSLRISLYSLGLFAAFGQSLSPAQAAEPRVALAASSQPSPALRSAHLLGRLDSAAALHVGLTLPLRNQSQLSELIRRQYTPGDPLFHQFITPSEFTERFGPTASDYAAVTAFARAQGLTVTSTSPGRTLLNVTGSSARIETAFGVQMSRYRLPGGREVFANSAVPRLPRSIAARVAGIAGLNNIAQMRPQISRMKSGALAGGSQSLLHANAPVPVTGTGTGIGSGPNGGLTPNDIKYAYDLNTITTLYGSSTAAPTGALTGAGQNIGLFELDGYLPADITAYVTAFSLPTVTSGTTASVTPILLGGFSGTPLTTPLQGGQREVTLDIDMILALAPAATGVYVYEDDGTVDTAAPLTIFTRMVTDLNPNGSKKPLLSVISCSWGIAESLEDPAILTGEDTLFQQMAAQGQSLFVASGDQGAYDLYGTSIVSTGVTAPAVDNPASQPFATGVGGTTLSYAKPSTNVTTGAVTAGAYVGETAWSDGSAILNPEGGGGGVSSVWPKPAYQEGVGSSSLRREVPDVSLNADRNTGYTVYLTEGTAAQAAEVVGGTSAAAPLWAAYTALINQQRATNGLTSIGFINPLLYPIATSSSYNTDFHDITTGSNLFYQAGTGYDDATGLGSFKGAPLLAALTVNANQGTGTATLTGIVSDSSAVVVVGAVVTATNSATGAVVATATTDTTGTYTLTVPSGLALILSVTTSGVTAPTTESLTGQTLTVAALTASTSTTLPITLVSSHVYAAGLQMISAPYSFAGIGDFAAVFGLTEAVANVSPRLVQYAPLLNSYIFYPASPADTLRLGQGYWVRFPSTAYLHITGTPAPTTQAFSIPLSPGWNQIGDPFVIAAPLSTITVTVASGTSALLPAASTIINPVLFGFNSTTGAYVALNPASDSLNPYAGYWIFAFQQCTLSVPVAGPPPIPIP